MSPHTASDAALEFADRRPNRRRRAPKTTPSLAGPRLARAAARQWGVVVGLTLLGAAAGFLQAYLMPASWAPYYGAGAGLLIGLLLAGAREAWREAVGFADFRKRLPYPVLGAAPELPPRLLRALPPDRRSPLGLLAFNPAASFSTAFRDLQGALPNGSVVAFVGSLPGDGATTAALCAAVSAVQQGRQVLVIDCDLRHRALTRALGFDPDEGVLEACNNIHHWQDYIDEEEETGLHFLPAARRSNAWRNLASAQDLPMLIARARETYDLVVLDCAPAINNADTPVVARLSDKTVMVTAWDRTPLGAVRSALRAIRARVRGGGTGIYVNRVPPDARFGRLRGD
ncbi:MAG: CpsD/CapB family tyrosine-protein kinase [Caulobacterales bacterium]|jgi:Mrp family chromosome partitioning ATPase|nr:CpsD/CapB family tyrosine-protein kinase [Caulobacterales bacterium]